MTAREQAGKEASPTTGVIDSQSFKTTESGGIAGCDAGKKVKGRKRHIVTDTLGVLLFMLTHAADIQDWDGAPEVIKARRFRFSWPRHAFADSGYAGPKLAQALVGHGECTMEIVTRSDATEDFVVLPRRWFPRVRPCENQPDCAKTLALAMPLIDAPRISRPLGLRCRVDCVILPRPSGWQTYNGGSRFRSSANGSDKMNNRNSIV